MQYVAPTRGLKAFTCPHCGVLARQYNYSQPNATFTRDNSYVSQDVIASTVCEHCGEFTLWVANSMVFPRNGTAPLPNPDMPQDVREDYEEAAEIASVSPKAAAALLRLSIQKLCVHLGGQGKSIDKDIAILVSNGLPELVQQSLDVVRVVGNHAVHPGQIAVDNPEAVGHLFTLVNVIVQTMISTPNTVSELYQALPSGARDRIAERDALCTTDDPA